MAMEGDSLDAGMTPTRTAVSTVGSDGDGVGDVSDDCPNDANTDQLDSNGDVGLDRFTMCARCMAGSGVNTSSDGCTHRLFNESDFDLDNDVVSSCADLRRAGAMR